MGNDFGNYGLRLAHTVVGLDALHFGLWEPNEELTVENLRRAQERYTDELLSLIPRGARTIVDVGCGTGQTALRLVERGYEVTALTPDPYQAALCRERLGSGAKVVELRFQEFRPARGCDLVLMSESSQYFKRKELFPAILRCLAPGGYALIADYFRKRRVRLYRNCDVDERFMREAEGAGLELLEEADVTSRAAPTLALARKVLDRYGTPFLTATRDAARAYAPVLSRILPLVFRRTFRKLRHYFYERLPAYTDADWFAREMRYMMRLFRRPPA